MLTIVIIPVNLIVNRNGNGCETIKYTHYRLRPCKSKT